MIDIANDLIQTSDYKPHEDPTKFKSQKTGRGPLVGKWQDTVSFSRPANFMLDWTHGFLITEVFSTIFK
jgi:hypothetical protein